MQTSESVFIIGCPRSGTSALAWALGQHPKLWASSESNFLFLLFGNGRIHHGFKFPYNKPISWFRENQVVYIEYCAFLGLGVDRLFLSRSGGRRWIEQSPENALFAIDLSYMFPNSKFVHIVRDGREVVSSMVNSGFGESWSHDFAVACETWVHYIKEVLNFQSMLPERTLEVRHNLLVNDTDRECQKILSFLRVEYSAEPAKFLKENRINSSYGNQHPDDIMTPKDTAELKEQKWKGWTPEQKEIFVKIAGPTMVDLGFGIDF